jgi:hypothetical protein
MVIAMTMYEGIDRDGRYLVDMLYAPAYTRLCITAIGMDVFSQPVLGDVMRKLHAALNPGGVLITSGDGIHPEGTQPAEMVVGWLHYTMKGMDFRMPGGLIPEAALTAGFKSVHTSTAPTCSGATEINVIRK